MASFQYFDSRNLVRKEVLVWFRTTRPWLLVNLASFGFITCDLVLRLCWLMDILSGLWSICFKDSAVVLRFSFWRSLRCIWQMIMGQILVREFCERKWFASVYFLWNKRSWELVYLTKVVFFCSVSSDGHCVLYKGFTAGIRVNNCRHLSVKKWI